MGCASSKQQLDQVTSIPSDDSKVTSKATPIKKESPLTAAAKTPSKNNQNKESHPASNGNNARTSSPNAPPPSAPTSRSPATPPKQISRLNLESQQDQEFKRQLETSLKARDGKRKVSLEAVQKAQKRSSQKTAAAPPPTTTQEQETSHHSTKVDYGNLEITLASDDPRGHGSFTSNNSSSNHNQQLLEQDASGKSHTTGRRASRRRSSSGGRKKSPSHHRRRRSKSPRTALSAEEDDAEEDVTKKRRIPANDPRSKPVVASPAPVVEASMSSHASRRKSHTKKEKEDKEKEKEKEKEVFVTTTNDNTKSKAMADISQLGASGDSLDYLSASGVSLDDDGEGDASHQRRRRKSSTSANKKYKQRERRATRKGDLDNLLEQDEENSTTHVNKEDDTKSRKSQHRKSATSTKSKNLSRQASKNSLSSRHSTSSRKSISSKKSTGSHHHNSNTAADPQKSVVSEKTTTKKPKRQSTTKSPHIPENDPRSVPAGATIASKKEKSPTINDAPPPLATMSQEQNIAKEVSPHKRHETKKRETSTQSTISPDKQSTISTDKNNNENTGTKNMNQNDKTPATTQTKTSRDSISRMEQIAKSMMGQKQDTVHDGATSTSSNINQSQHSSLGAPSQHSLGAPSQHSLNCYLPDGIKGSANKNNSGGAGSRLSQNGLSSTTQIDTSHETFKLEELPENMDESAEFAQEDENDAAKGDAGNQMPKNVTASTSRPSIAQRIVNKINPLKKKSNFEGGHALTDADEGFDDDAFVVVEEQQQQTAIDNSYRKSRVPGVLKQIVKKKHKKGKDSGVEQDESDRGSVHDSTGESIHSLDLLSPDPTVGNQQEEQEQQGVDPVVFKFDASDTSIAQFDPSALNSNTNNISSSLLMMHSSCSAVDRIHQRRSVRGKRAAAARSHQASLTHKGTAGADSASTNEDGGSDQLKLADLHNSLSQVDELKAEAAFNKKLRTKKKRPKATRPHRAGQSSHNTSGTDQDDTASVQSSDSRQASEKPTAATTTAAAAQAGQDTSTVTATGNSAAVMTKDQSLRDGSMKGHSLRTTDGSGIDAAPTPTRVRQRRRLSETHRNKGPSTPTNPSRRGSAHDASPSLSGGSRRSTSQRRRRSGVPKVPTSLDDGADD